MLRSYLRQRQMLIRYGSQHVQHMQKALEQMNVKLAEVVSDVSGVTGMAIIRAILRGERNPLELAKLRNDHCKRTEAQIARALYGNWRAEHLFALQQAVTLYDCYRQQLQVCDDQLHAYLGTFADQSQGRPRPQRQVRRRRERRPNDPASDVANLLYRIAGVDLTVLEGIDANTALVILRSAGATRGESSRAYLPPGGARLSSCQTRARSVLPTYSGSRRFSKGDRGHGAKACRARVSAAEVRSRVCLPGDGSLRDGLSKAAA